MHATGDTWTSRPGNFDVHHTELFTPETTIRHEMPIIRNTCQEIPIALTHFRHKDPGLKDAAHFFVDDYRFECLWNRPQHYADKFQGRMVLSPDFSLYTDWNENVNRWNHYRKQWLGSYFQSEGCHVIPTVGWADERSYPYCFSGIEEGSQVALSVIGCLAFNELFVRGFNAMLEMIRPSRVLCLGNFSKMWDEKTPDVDVVEYEYRFGQTRCMRILE